MNESNGCTCCACQYSTPPWWVTMGFIPPYSYQGPSQSRTASPPVQVQPPARTTTTTETGGTTPTAPPQQGSSNPLTGIINGVLGPIGGLLGGLF